MKPTTYTDLQSILDTDLVWRRRELTSMLTSIGVADSAAKVTLIRSGVPLLYAHWEGFGRVCFQRYLEHVSLRSLKFKNLAPSFLYLTSIGRIQEIGRSPAKVAVPLLPGIFDTMNKVNRNAFRKMVDTKSNLRFETLEGLCATCGLDSSMFADDKLFIDHEICDPRNEIAHGLSLAPTQADFVKRRDRTFAIMTKLQSLIVNAAVERSFEIKDKSNATSK